MFFNNRYQASYLKCYYERIMGTPSLISIEANGEESENPRVLYKPKVVEKKWTDHDPPRFAWCISPLYGHIDYPLFIEVTEFNLLLGVEFIVAYNHSADASLAGALRYYSSIGLMTLVQFLDFRVPAKEVQQMAFSECLLRTMGTFRYMINTDIDEIIVPQSVRTLAQLVGNELRAHLSSEYRILHVAFLPAGANISAYNVIHKPECACWNYNFSSGKPFSCFALDNSTKVQNMPSIVLRHYRDQYVWESKVRSKVVVQSEDVTFLGPHLVLGFSECVRPTTYTVPPNVALLYHFRKTEVRHWMASEARLLYVNIVNDCRVASWLPELEDAISNRSKSIRFSLNSF